jgi:hypothetical protein
MKRQTHNLFIYFFEFYDAIFCEIFLEIFFNLYFLSFFCRRGVGGGWLVDLGLVLARAKLHWSAIALLYCICLSQPHKLVLLFLPHISRMSRPFL